MAQRCSENEIKNPQDDIIHMAVGTIAMLLFNGFSKIL